MGSNMPLYCFIQYNPYQHDCWGKKKKYRESAPQAMKMPLALKNVRSPGGGAVQGDLTGVIFLHLKSVPLLQFGQLLTVGGGGLVVG